VGNPTEKNNVHGSVYGVFNECNFPGNHDAEFVQLLLYHGTQTTSGLASAAANQGGCSRVSRVGDAAYFCTGKVMLTLKGSTELDVDGSAGVSKSALVKLAKIAVGRL
jgi:hypothetical protein